MDHDRDTQEADKPSRSRSPSFPFIALPKAIERARILFEAAGHREVSFEELASAWNYGIRSSGALQSAAALGQFGLLESYGPTKARRYRLTPDALRLLQKPDVGSEDYRAALQRAALRPKVFSELASHFRDKEITDAAVVHYLVHGRRDIGELPFTDRGAKDVVGKLKESLGFAGVELSRSSSVSDKMEVSLTHDTSCCPPSLPESQARLDRPAFRTSPTLATGERLLLGGELGTGAYYRLIVHGKFGAPEIDGLMRQLQVAKEYREKEERTAGDEGNGV
jgi:hypothetical protein